MIGGILTRGLPWLMKPEDVGNQVAMIIDLPEEIAVNEMTISPIGELDTSIAIKHQCSGFLQETLYLIQSFIFEPDDGLLPKILCYITMKSTWNMMNLLKFGVESFQNGLL